VFGIGFVLEYVGDAGDIYAAMFVVISLTQCSLLSQHLYIHVESFMYTLITLNADLKSASGMRVMKILFFFLS